MAIEAGRTLAKPVISLVVFALFLVCMDLINSIYPITGLKAIIISVIVIGITMSFPKKYNRLGKSVVIMLVLANIVLVITTFLPGRKSTLISKWWHLDNSTRVEYEQGEDMSKNAMERFKDKEEILGKQADSCLKIFDFVGAQKFRDSLINEGENLKNSLAKSDSIKITNRKKYEEQPQFQQVVYQPEPIQPRPIVPVFQQKFVTFGANEKVHTGLMVMNGSRIHYSQVESPFKILGDQGQLVPINGPKEKIGMSDYTEIIIHGGPKPGSFLITVEIPQ